MKKKLLNFILPVALIASVGMNGQARYLNEVFTDSQIQITNDVTYGVNVDWLRTNTGAPQLQIVQEITEIKTALAMSNPIPLKYYLTNDSTTATGDSTAVKVAPLKMDIYEPIQADDYETERVVMVYLHTGNFIPPPYNGQPTGRKEDWTGVELCKQWAKRGYVAVSMGYRGGWLPLSTVAEVRRGTLLNAVYRAIHDVQQGVRFLRDDADGSNTYGIDKDNIILYGQGSGGYVALGYATLDKHSEMEIPKFINPATNPPASYIDTNIVGNVHGMGGFMNLYTNPTGQSTEIQMCINAGGALADSSWLEAGDAPMVTLHCVRDQFAPFENGMVIVTTTGEQVVEVQGPNIFIKKANALGNNDAFLNNTFTDPYTTRAKAVYGNSYSYWHPVQTTQSVEAGLEGCFPVIIPLQTATAPPFNQASPWEWWDPTHPLSTAVVGSVGGNPITAHQNNLFSNPDMSETKGKTYVDTIQGYIHPRIAMVLKANGVSIGVDENEISSQFAIYPNPTSTEFRISSTLIEKASSVEIMNISGQVVKTVEGVEFNNSIDVSDLAKGAYFIVINTNEGKAVKKLMIQ